MTKAYCNFKATWLGKVIDYDGMYGYQCVDLYRLYCKHLGFPQSPNVRAAVDIWDTYLEEHFERIPYEPGLIPQQGSVIIWDLSVGDWGHLALFDRKIRCRDGFISIDQNWPGAGRGIREVEHTYDGVIGWLRPILESSSEEANIT